MPALKQLHVAMDEILEALVAAPDGSGAGYLDLTNGSVVNALPDGAENPDRFVEIPRVETSDQYEWMRTFAESVTEPDVRAKLDLALYGKGAFGRFRDLVSRYLDLQEGWETMRQQALIALAERWLRAELGIEPSYELRKVERHVGARPAGDARASVGLVDLLLLGAPDGKTELVGGRVKRRLRMPSTAEARGAFKRLARDICHHYAVEWRNRFIEGKDTFDHDRMHLALQGEVVEVSVDVSASIWKTFT